jgi:uncharacterized membrane protein YbhN (UPF0104 family)
MTARDQRQRLRPKGIARWIRRHAQVQKVLPLIVGVGLIAYVMSIAVAPKSGGQLWQIVKGTWWLIFLLTLPYLGLRALIWRKLLEGLNINVPWRPLIASFAGGEMTKAFPAGVYVENFLLAKVEHFRSHAAVRSSMATTAMLGLESLIAVPTVLIVGVPGLSWLRVVVLAIVGAWIVLLGAVWLFVHYRSHKITEKSPLWQREINRIARDFLDAGKDLIAWRTLLLAVPTAVYVFIYMVDLFVIVRAVGITDLSLVHVMAIYAFTVLVVILIPIPTEIGLTEFSGLSAFVGYGVPRAEAAVIMLGLRALATGMTIVVAGIAMLVLRSELTEPEPESRPSGGETTPERNGGSRAEMKPRESQQEL